MGKQKKQHYIPRFYLKHFCDPESCDIEKIDPYLWLVDKFSKESKRRGTNNFGYGNDIYSINDTDSSVSFEFMEKLIIEFEPELYSTLKQISNKIEDVYNKAGEPLVIEEIFSKNENVIATIIQRIAISNELYLSLLERRQFSFYIGHQIVRTVPYLKWTKPYINKAFYEKLIPVFVNSNIKDDMINEMVSKIPNGIADKFKALGNEQLISLLQSIPMSEMETEMSALPLVASLERARLISEFLINRKWQLLSIINKDEYFITSDNPIVIINDDNDPVIFPLNPKKALYITGNENSKDGEMWRVENKSDLDIINRCIINNAYQYVICSNDKMVEWVKTNL